jgi:Asp/Glu/hydantoin racemase
MQVRLWHQSTTELQRDAPYSRALIRHARDVLGDMVVIDTFGLPPGAYHGRTVSGANGNAFVYHRMLGHVIDQAMEAERQRYDGFVIGSYSEPFLKEIRAAVDTPVTSILETTLLVGCSLGSKLAFVTTSPNVVRMIKKAIAFHQMEARVSDIVSLDPALEEPMLLGALENPKFLVESFERAAAKAIANGADVIIPGEGILAVVLVENGLTRLQDAPVMDVFGVTWSYAMMLANLRVKSRMGMTRRGWYARPDVELIHLLRKS